MTSDRLENLARIGQLKREPRADEVAGQAPGHWRVLAKAHEKRNLAEYEGYLEQDERLLTDMLAATRTLADALAE